MKNGRLLFHPADDEILRDMLKAIPEKNDLD